MEVEVVRSIIVQPDYGKDNSPIPPINEVPLTIFDQLAMKEHVAVLFAFAGPTPSNSTIIAALSKTLAYFPTLAGCFSPSHRSILIDLGSTTGILVVEAVANGCQIADLLPLAPSKDSFLYPPREATNHLLQVQLTRFTCGGLVLGFTWNHQAADGQSMSHFYTALGRAARGLPVEPQPSYDPDWLKPRSPPRCDCKHWGVGFSHAWCTTNDAGECFGSMEPRLPSAVGGICSVQLHFSTDFIQTQLKQQLPSGQKYSTFQVLTGYMWRKITVARHLQPDTQTHVSIPVNGRPRLRPPVSPAFFGNLVLTVQPHARAADITPPGGTATAVRLIKEALEDTGDTCFRSVIDFEAMHVEETLSSLDAGTSMCPDLEVDSWLGFRFEELDIGGGRACGFSNEWIPVEGVLVMFPEHGEDGENGGGKNVCVNVTLFEEHARELVDIVYFAD